jgi:hypothetical protein
VSGRLALAAALLCLLLVGCQTRPAGAPSDPTPGKTGGESFDHSVYDEVMRAHVSEDGLFDYRTAQAEHADALKRYLGSLAAADPEGFAGEDDELAFWLNAYNAFVIAGVLEHYPGIESVMDFPDFFEAERWEAAGELRSLNEIENEIIRPEFGDPRIHFILVCAGMDCPPLPAQAMVAETLQADLERYARSAVNSGRYVEVRPDGKALRLTSIMRWYKKDFVDKHGSLEGFLVRYLDEPARSQLKEGGYSIEFADYDWALNDAGRSATE